MSTATASDAPTEDSGRKRRFVFPHTYAIILGMIFLATVATWLIPAGVYDTKKVDVNGTTRTLVVDGSYHHVDQNPVNLFEMFQAIPVGLGKGAEIVFYIFLIAGTFSVIQRTGAIEGLISVLVKKFSKADIFLVPILMTTFSVLGFTIGMAEEGIIFVPIVIALMRSFKYDAITGTAIVLLGAGTGFMGGIFNPFTVGIAQGIAQVELFSAWQYRAAVWVVFLSVAILYVIRHARKVRKDPSASPIADVEATHAAKASVDDYELIAFTWRHAVVLLSLLVAIAVNIWGIFTHGWFLTEMAGVYLMLMIWAGLIGGLGVNGTFDSLVDGFKEVAFGAMIVGFARAILVVLEQGQVIHTVLHALSTWIGEAPHGLIAVLMLTFQVFMNLIIPSGSGQAAATMPIMAPLADILGFERQIAVFAFHYGDGISNAIIPTSASILAMLALAKIPYEKWAKWVWPYVLIQFCVASAAIVVAQMIGIK